MFDLDELADAIVTCCYIALVLILAIAALSVAGCGGASLPPRTFTPNADDVTLFIRTEERWTAAGLPSLDTERCVELRQYMRVVIADDEDFPEFCHRCNPGNCPGYRPSEACPRGCGHECYTTPCAGSFPHCWGDGEFLGGHEHSLIVIHESQAPNGYPNPDLVRHGYLHYLVSCSGLVNGSADPGHQNDVVWQQLDRP